MSRIIAASGLAFSWCVGALGTPNYEEMWKNFLDKWPKDYETGEEEKRFQIFKMNVDTINEENAKGHSHTLGVTEFADLTLEEFSGRYFGYDPSLRKQGLESVAWVAPNGTAPESIDWVSKGAVTPVKNQAHCGSCWAFSATGSVEGAYFVATGKLLSVSEEELVQCDSTDNGCQGGAMDNAFDWIKKHGGICEESQYPYTSATGVRGTCHKGCSPAVIVGGHTDVPPEDEEALKKAVAQQPVSVAIEADKRVFQLYKGGVLTSSLCGKKLDHGVLAVGYGTDSKGNDYWKVKNSWGPGWGEDGYIKLARGKNMCGIAMQPTYPTGVKAAPPAPPSPPTPPSPPSPPSPSKATHYEDPTNGCQSDEKQIRIEGVSGATCVPSCGWFGSCPHDVPAGVTATPKCVLKTQGSSKKYCALLCTPNMDDGQCGKNASCKSVQGMGVCTYDDGTTKLMSTATAQVDVEDKEIVV